MALETNTISALLSYLPTARNSNIQQILPKFSSLLKDNFENRSLWLRFGLTLTLSKDSPRNALQAFNECLRIDQYDPLPAMLAAKLMLLDLDDPEGGLNLIKDAISRCQKLTGPIEPRLDEQINNNLNNNNNHIISDNSNPQIKSDQDGKCHQSTSQQTNGTMKQTSVQDKYLETRCCYKKIVPMLSKCYLLASIMHAYIYEREPESIKQFKVTNLKASQNYLDLAIRSYSKDHLVYFHKALHEARQRSYPSSIDNLRQAIKLNQNHVPSIQLLILSLSGLKLYDEALVLCEATLHEYKDDMFLLYIKCNLEQYLVESKGYKAALDTARHMLKCVRKKSTFRNKSSQDGGTPVTEAKHTTNLFADNQFDTLRFQPWSSADELSIWLLIAEIFIKIGSVDDAELCINEGSLHANGALSHHIMFARALVAKARNNLFEAKGFLQSCLALCPRSAKALQQLGHVNYLLGNHSAAEKYLKDSADLDNDSFKTWHYLSLVFIETNQLEKVNECVKKATLLEESSPIIPIAYISRLTLE